MRKVFGLTFLFLALVSSVFAKTEKLFEEANNAYKDENYQTAAEKYEQLVKGCKKMAGVYFNLGNAYFKNDEIGKAILSYERAKRIAPDDEDIAHNLAYARSFVKDKISTQADPISKFRQKVFGIFSSFTWAVSAIGLIWLSLIFYVLYLFVYNFRRATFFLGTVCFLFSLIFFFSGRQQEAIEEKCGFGIVTIGKIFVKSAPDNNAADLFVLHEGTEVSILDRVDGYSKIRLADGQVGWLEIGAFTRI